MTHSTVYEAIILLSKMNLVQIFGLCCSATSKGSMTLNEYDVLCIQNCLLILRFCVIDFLLKLLSKGKIEISGFTNNQNITIVH